MIESRLVSEMPLKGLTLVVAAVVVRRSPRLPPHPTTTTTTLHTCAAATLANTRWTETGCKERRGSGWMDCIALPAGCEEFQQIPAMAMPEWWRAEGVERYWGWSLVTQTLLFKGANC